jgi:hypothetical protein
MTRQVIAQSARVLSLLVVISCQSSPASQTADGGAGDAESNGLSDAASDAACANDPGCEGHPLPGCTRGPPVCVNGVNQCAAVVCDEAGSEDAASGDAASPDASSPFVCSAGDAGTLQCDGRTQMCLLAVGGCFGCTHPPSCEALPAACSSDRTCACVTAQPGEETMPCEEDAGNITVTEDLP